MADFAVEEQFAYSDGDLNGQNGGSGWSGAWSADVLYDVASSVPPTGATKYVVVQSAAAEPTASRSFSATADSGDWYFSIRKAGTGNAQSINLKQSTNRAIDVSWNTAGGNIVITGTTSQTIITSPTIDTWYDINIQFVTTTTMRARGKLSSDTTWGSWTSAVTLGVTGSPNGIDNITLRYNQAGATDPNFYFARFQTTDPSAVAATTPLQMMMGVGT